MTQEEIEKFLRRVADELWERSYQVDQPFVQAYKTASTEMHGAAAAIHAGVTDTYSRK